MNQLPVTQHIRYRLTPIPFGTLPPSGRNVVYVGNVSRNGFILHVGDCKIVNYIG